MHSSRKRRVCDVDGCSDFAMAFGLCSLHYNRQRHGKALPPRRGERVPRATAPWEYEGDEAALAAMTEEQEKANVEHEK